MVKYYRKKPVTIRAFHFKDTSFEVVKSALVFMGQITPDLVAIQYEKLQGLYNIIKRNNEIAIPTLEGVMQAKVGDYIIKGIQGEFYPCKPDIFEQTYELIEND